MKKNSIMTAIAVLLSFASFAVSPITGSSVVCTGSTITLTDSTTGGTWSSSNTALATISSGGVVSGVTSGAVIITYDVGASLVTLSITVNPTPAPITGGSTVCVGATVILSDAIPGGSWAGGGGVIATVSASGVVTGLAAGVTNIYYVAGGCGVYRAITVNASPAPITGSSVLCTGATITLSDATTGGTWSAGGTSIATVSSSGVVTGVGVGVTNIYYVVGGCGAYHTVTVNHAPSSITGPSTVCVGSTATLLDSVSGGSWFSSNTALSTVSSSGTVTGVSPGTLTIYYTTAGTLSGCIVTHTITVNASSPILGPSSVCVGSTITLIDSVTGGTWSGGGGGIATVSSSGVVTGLAAGVTNIYYVAGGCGAYHTVTVNAAATITGSSTVCIGSTITLSATPAGGTWSGGGGIATVSSSGVVTGLTAGVTNIYYVAGGCGAYHTVTVNAAATITGSSTVCIGSTITLSATPAGGTWSGGGGIATVSSSGVVTGLTAGVTNIYYVAGGCGAYHTVTVNAAATITGSSTLCIGSTITLSASPAGGTWSGGGGGIATVSSSGVVTGLTAGVTNIYYVAGGCGAYHTVTVNAAATITGSSTVCIGSTITLSASPAGGTWTASGGGIATVSSSGVVTGLTAGVTNIYYVAGGCGAYHTVTVNAAATITGSSTVCIGSTITLSATPAGGTWSGGGGIATVSSSGVVTGLTAGVTNIYYVAGGCGAYHTVTVNAAATITGSSTVCIGSTITLSATPAGGTWTASGGGIATVSSSGVVTGLTAGVTNIYYVAGGCGAYHTVTVNAAATITGSSTVCIGSTITLSATPAGGTWTASGGGIATVSSSGIVTGLATGVANIYYNAGGCYAYHTVTVNAAATITGSSTVCIGSAITLSATPAGGTWSGGGGGIATVSSSGVVTGLTAGVTNIYYVAGGCGAYHTVTVNAAATITGSSTVCIGSTITLSATPAGGTWTASGGGIATVSSSGVVTGLTAGVTNIYYIAGGCGAYHTVTVNAAATITGSSTVCIGSTITLSATPAGGTWSGGGGIATVSSSGVVTGLTAGVTNIYYVAGGCGAYHTVTVNAAATITGSSTVCIGSTITLSATPAGGTWSGGGGIATVSSSGVVTGLTAGVTNIYYVAGGCGAYHTVTVNAAATITGSSTVCIGSTITLSATPAGGTWTASGGGIATVSSSGVVTGLTAGVTNIYYVAGGCGAYHTITVNAIPAPISGPSLLCVGTTITLTDATSGGTWVGGSTPVATVSSSGAVTGVSPGVSGIYYVVGGCSAYHMVTVNPAPAAITGSSVVYIGATITLGDAVPGGTWLSGNTSLATVSTGGVVTGVSAGVLNIYYTMGSTLSGCTAYHPVTVTPVPGPGVISGHVYSGAGKGTSGLIPVEGMPVQLQDAATGSVLTAATTDATGAYSFTGLVYGDYIVAPSFPGYATTPSAAISLSTSAQTITDVDFKQNTSDFTIIPFNMATVIKPLFTTDGISVYPNPTTGNIHIKWTEHQASVATIVITDMTGREVYRTELSIASASGDTQIDVSILKVGTYMLSITSGNIFYGNKLVITK